MIRNYLKIAWRNLIKNPTYSFINIAGLAVGLATCLIITLYVLDDLSFDADQPHADHVVLFQQYLNSSSSGSAFIPLLQKQAGIEAVTEVAPHRALITMPEISAYENRFCLADSQLTRVLDFPMVEGSLQQALSLPNQLVISERMAGKYFGTESPLGKTMDVQIEGKVPFTVVGVMQNTPENTHLPIDFLASSLNGKTLLNRGIPTYWNFAGMHYLLLSEGVTLEQMKQQLPEVVKQTEDPNAGVWKLDVIPLRDIYLRNRMDDRVRATNAIEFVRIFSAVALCILLLACFNYLNLSSARSTLRAREVGVRKAMGAERSQLIGQFLGESFLFTAIAMFLALLLAQLALPFFNDFADKRLSLRSLLTTVNLVYVLGAMIITSLLTGLYPAFVLSKFNPVRVLKNYLLPTGGRAYVRRGLVVVQFTISIVMLVATLVVMSQLRYVQNKDVGYQREQVLSLKLPAQATESQSLAFRNELQRLAAVEDLTQVSMLPGTGVGINKVTAESVKESENDLTIGQLWVDSQFQTVFGVKMAKGRFFQKDNTADRSNFVVNQTAVHRYGWKIGQTIGYTTYRYNPDGSYGEVPVNGQIIGIAEDFNQMDLKSKVLPMMLINNGSWGPIALKLQGTDLTSTVPLIKKAWNVQFPTYPFEYSFLDEAFDKIYRKESQTARVFGLFAGLSIFISCLGLLGLVAFTAEQRTKEIGIRKVMGASVSSIVSLLSKDFLKLVFIALVLAAPIAWYGMDAWLHEFAYRVDVSVGDLLAAGSIALLVALATVSYQAVKAGLKDPVKSLRSE